MNLGEHLQMLVALFRRDVNFKYLERNSLLGKN
jgi:hypothetical protein